MTVNRKTGQAENPPRQPTELAEEALDKAVGGASAHEVKKSLIGNFPR